MSQLPRRFVIAIVSLLLSSPAAFAGEFFEVDGLALRGYDPVAYVELDAPTPGKPEHHFVHQGSKFLFASAANRTASRIFS